MLQQFGKADIMSIGATYSGNFSSAIHPRYLIETTNFQNVLSATRQYQKQAVYISELQNISLSSDGCENENLLTDYSLTV